MTEAPEVGAPERVRVVAPEGTAGHLEVREPPLLASEVELERRLDLRPTLIQPIELSLGDVPVLVEDALATVGVETRLTGDLGVSVVCVDPQLGHLLVLLDELTIRVLQAHDVGEPEQHERKRLAELIHSYDLVAHGPLLLVPRSREALDC